MELTFASLLLLPVGLGLLGFIEPCTIGAHVIFLSAQQKRDAGAKAAAVISFVGVRVLVMGAFGALLGVLGDALIDVQTWLWFLFGAVYFAIGLVFATGRGGFLEHRFDLGRGAWRYARNPVIMGAAFGLNIPACAAPILFGLLGMTIASGATTGFLMMSLFGLALSVPLIPMALMPSLAGWLTHIAAALRTRPWITATAFLILGVWSIYFGLFVDLANWSGR